ncbi:glycoside hydrolase family 25 protein [Aurantiacibacter sediminis]|uniref:Glycoside hydrolase family 25 protein n=1 Tax=Aurantiacibacter sediminis TaxID=2793064 RepID=A0ABS0MZB8_9SPHN|nr:glycoside hydrolase family 25 protein [Aurantiacibacter sediminis]MBH5321065.1 glycoside hydrolase family 25 protein [Aurantiacibacter sediminis]
MGKKKKSVLRFWIEALLLIALIGVGVGLWWHSKNWAPPRAEYPVQGVVMGEAEGIVDISALRTARADFVYLEASSGAEGRDQNFGRNLAALTETDIPHGAVHTYDPCIPAEEQAANFVTIVPRDATLMPPAIYLNKKPSECGDPVLEAALESELTTFINQVEGHAGQPVVLKISEEFARQYQIATRIERNLWLERDWLQPDYAGRPWTLWTANSALTNAANSEPMRWVVVQN